MGTNISVGIFAHCFISKFSKHLQHCIFIAITAITTLHCMGRKAYRKSVLFVLREKRMTKSVLYKF
jgi:multisubunit Na+/H+ antiporter MnhG subunit